MQTVDSTRDGQDGNGKTCTHKDKKCLLYPHQASFFRSLLEIFGRRQFGPEVEHPGQSLRIRFLDSITVNVGARVSPRRKRCTLKRTICRSANAVPQRYVLGLSRQRETSGIGPFRSAVSEW